MLKQIRQLVAELIVVLRLLRRFLWWLMVSPPGLGTRTQLRKYELMKILVVDVDQALLEITDIDVAQQRLVVTVNGVAREPLMIDRTATSVELTALPIGATVELSLDYLDAAGNDSANFPDEFVVTDELGPAAPLGFGARTQVRQYEVEVADA